MGCLLSLDAKINYKVGGVAAGGSWVENDHVKNATLNMERTEADATLRSNGGYAASVGTLKQVPLEIETLWDVDNTHFAIFLGAFLNGDTIGIQALDKMNGEGIEADMQVLSLSREEDIEGVIVTNMLLKPTCSDTEPVWLQGGTNSA